MSQKLNELVMLLSEKQEVECSRPQKTAFALRECIDRGYVHIKFLKTGTEIGVTLSIQDCKFEGADFENGHGEIQLNGGLTLNYNRVRCIANIDLDTCKGHGYLVPVESEEEYRNIMQGSGTTAR